VPDILRVKGREGGARIARVFIFVAVQMLHDMPDARCPMLEYVPITKVKLPIGS
jgi:hypothetical protein